MYLYNFRYSLRGNYIETIPLEPFHVLRQLDRLDLGENFLTSLPPIMFNGTLTVNDLNLEYNYIERLEDSAFISLQPRRLYLGHNRISYIDPKTFNGVELLVELVDLEANKLNEVSEVCCNVLYQYTYWVGINAKTVPNLPKPSTSVSFGIYTSIFAKTVRRNRYRSSTYKYICQNLQLEIHRHIFYYKIPTL